MEHRQEVSKAVIQRLPRYYRNICELKAEGAQRISSRALAERMGLTASQIRQDFNCFGGFGQQGYGYNIEKLQEELGAILGLRAGRTAILLGAGNLGRALLNNFNFSASGFELLCAFDASPELIGRSFGGYEVRDAKELDHYIDELHPDVAVLTIPRGNAPAIARSLVERGIRGLWNFTGEDLHLEGLGVPVENVHLSDSLMTLCQLVGMAEENED
ncbi:redox-sensing transcriptional repressor Rex [Agathobaculum butyriciproducens]|uniref:Redox-sensing transcriptional repressor Rex n=1 Tax=Agathobaculum hominis TaxID=2763014 RepID=A0ABR7GPT8_9FIRM|nr:redox-sensing transcriptional repressor Rex [Agathobaculum hominis]MCO7160912.1 redox-sensing transcriptional repressor Rex [Agathobaculum butyriciproducens]MEE0389726.1 redox-sensing transcriptional repressor Rex [Agathobaculum sp.]